MLWRRSYDVPPPPIEPDDPGRAKRRPGTPHYPPMPAPQPNVSRTSSADSSRTGRTCIVADDLRAGRTVLVAAHGNSLRAMVKHLDNISDADIAGVNIPTGIPLVYRLDGNLRPDRTRRRIPRSRRGGHRRCSRCRPGQSVNQPAHPAHRATRSPRFDSSRVAGHGSRRRSDNGIVLDQVRLLSRRRRATSRSRRSALGECRPPSLVLVAGTTFA